MQGFLGHRYIQGRQTGEASSARRAAARTTRDDVPEPWSSFEGQDKEWRCGIFRNLQ